MGKNMGKNEKWKKKKKMKENNEKKETSWTEKRFAPNVILPRSTQTPENFSIIRSSTLFLLSSY